MYVNVKQTWQRHIQAEWRQLAPCSLCIWLVLTCGVYFIVRTFKYFYGEVLVIRPPFGPTKMV